MEQIIRTLLETSLTSASGKGQLQLDSIPSIVLELPREKDHGDLSTNVAMILAKKLKVPPSLVAQSIVENLPADKNIISKVIVAGPGFINFFFTEQFFQETLLAIAKQLSARTPKNPLVKEKILLEFVSANPTGPLNVVNARAAAVGDTLARLLGEKEFQAEREFYVNDEGSQIDNLARSVEARYLELLGNPPTDFPEDWYSGEYIKELAKHVRDGFKHTEIFSEEGVTIYGADTFTHERLEFLKTGFSKNLFSKIPNEKERLRFLGCTAVIYMVNLQRKILDKFRLHFQSWYFQSQLGDSVQKNIEKLNKAGHLYEQDGAIWFRTSTFHDDKDRVLIRQEGQPTYFAADIAYHAHKKERGYQRLINLLGPDHHGYIARSKALIQALGYPEDSLEIYLIQLVTLMSGGKPLRMSKRAGEFITMAELLDEVGVDAARWYFLNRHRDSHLEFDLDLAKLQSDENPLYYVQYAHARISSILRSAKEQQIKLPTKSTVDLSPLVHPTEKELIKKMAQWQGVLSLAVDNREPHHLPRYAMELARTFHSFYTECRVLDAAESKLTLARLFLIDTCRHLLAQVLDLMGISSPNKM